MRHHPSRLLELLSLIFCLSSATGLAQPMQIKFKTAGESMIVVPVTINRTGPFDFLLDTGAAQSLVDRKLAEELHLPPVGKVVLETAAGGAVTRLVHTNSVRMADGYVLGLNLLVVDHYIHAADLSANVRGILGEDFLRYFDVFVDYWHQLIQFEVGPGPLGDMLIGEHLPLSAYGSEGKKLDSDELIIDGHLDLRSKDAKLLLDSGIPSLVLFSQLSTPGIWQPVGTFLVKGVLGTSFAAYYQTGHLWLGKKYLNDVTVVVPTQNMPPQNVDGLLPTSLFRSIFISHSGRFVILDPSRKPALAQSTPPSRADPEIPDLRPLSTK